MTDSEYESASRELGDLKSERGDHSFPNNKPPLSSEKEARLSELDKIVRKPANELTAKEAAERKIIVNWIFLVKKGDTFNGIINNPSVRKFKFFWEDVIDGIIPENIKTDLDATMKPGN